VSADLSPSLLSHDTSWSPNQKTGAKRGDWIHALRMKYITSLGSTTSPGVACPAVIFAARRVAASARADCVSLPHSSG
jgi:hypothetical protein